MTPRVLKQPTAIEPAYAPSRVIKSTARPADELLAEARTQANQILADAQEKALAIEQRALAESATKFDAVIRPLEALCRQERDAFARCVFDAAVMISARIVGPVIDRDAEPFVGLIERVVREAGRYHTIRVALHPADAAAIAPHAERLRNAIPVAESLTVEADETLQRGDILARTEAGDYEGGLHHVVRSLRQALAGTREA